MKIAEYVGNNIVIIEPHGRLTIETVQFFRRAIAKRRRQRFAVRVKHFCNRHGNHLDAQICGKRARVGLAAFRGKRSWHEPHLKMPLLERSMKMR